MAALPKLVDLPEELFDQVTSYLHPTDFFALRETSRAIVIAIESRFLEAFFSARSHLFTLHGIETLAHIAEHPRLIHQVKKLRLVIAAPDTHGIPHQLRGRVRAAFRYQHEHLNSRYLHLLATFFSAIATGPHAATFELALTDVCSPPSLSGTDYGATHLEKLLNAGPLRFSPYGGLKGHASRILSVVARTEHLALASLHIDIEHEEGPRHVYLPFDCDPPMRDEKRLFNNLTTLNLDFGHVYFNIDDRDLVERHTGFYELLGHAGRLEVLKLAGYGGWTSSPSHNGEFFRCLAEAVSPDAPLRHLALSWYDIDERDLRALVAQKVGKLQHLKLEELTLGKDERWAEIFTLLQTRGRVLDTVELKSLRCDDEDIDTPQDRLRQLVLGIQDDEDGEDGNGQDQAVEDTCQVSFNFRDRKAVEGGLRMVIEDGSYWMS